VIQVDEKKLLQVARELSKIDDETLSAHVY
jgi:hypothetical protein